MYNAFLNTVREGRSNAMFTLQPSAVASRCNIASINTVKAQWDKLEAAGAIRKEKMNFDQSYPITFNPALLCAQKDKNFAKEIADKIIHKAPGLQKNDNFREWR